MTEADELFRALGTANGRRLLEILRAPKARTVKVDILLGPVRRHHAGGRRSVELLTTEIAKSLDEGEVDAHNLSA